MRVTLAQLHLLAGLYGIRTSYLDMHQSRVRASRDSLLAVLRAVGAPVSGMQDVPDAIRARRLQYWQRTLEPVTVLRENEILTLDLRLSAGSSNIPVRASLFLEDGTTRILQWRGEETFITGACDIEGSRYVTMRLYLPEHLPYGYHRLKMELPGQTAETLIISAPARAYSPPVNAEKIWGVFLPLYSLHTSESRGAGSFADLETLLSWVSELGGRIVGTLPLSASLFDKEFGPTPYAPASRLFWNEFYLDLDRVPGLSGCPSAQEILFSSGYRNAVEDLRSSPYVDYGLQLSLQRKVLEKMADCFFAERTGRFPDFQSYLARHPMLEDYARFRAFGEVRGINWHQWPDTPREGDLKDGSFPEPVKQYYAYTQWLAQEQIQSLSQKARQDNVFLYLDLPLGVHPYSYDVWRERDSFVTAISGGAPPDPVFTSGQDWRFPPLHPENIRSNGYRYLVHCLQCQLEHAGMLRIDHMMNFHRLFWIPHGMDSRDGVYVNYRPDELYAILVLESYRHKAVIIGEDLGIVPPEVRPVMVKNGIFRLFIGQFELAAGDKLGSIPSPAVAGLNTHDMYPFAAFWQEKDISARQKLNLVDPQLAAKELAQRRRVKRTLRKILRLPKGETGESPDESAAALKAVLELLASSPAYAVLVNLEDLWLETRPQNIPGTQNEHNWKRKARYSFPEFSRLPEVVDLLRQIDRLRKGEPALQ